MGQATATTTTNTNTNTTNNNNIERIKNPPQHFVYD